MIVIIPILGLIIGLLLLISHVKICQQVYISGHIPPKHIFIYSMLKGWNLGMVGIVIISIIFASM